MLGAAAIISIFCYYKKVLNNIETIQRTKESDLSEVMLFLFFGRDGK